MPKFSVPKIGRDTILFVGGLAGIAHETLISEQERSALLVLFATMVGLPAFLRSDEKPKEPTPPVAPAPPAEPTAPEQYNPVIGGE